MVPSQQLHHNDPRSKEEEASARLSEDSRIQSGCDLCWDISGWVTVRGFFI